MKLRTFQNAAILAALVIGLLGGWWLGENRPPERVFVQAPLPEPPTAADLHRIRLDLELRDTPLQKALDDIRLKTGLNVVVLPDALRAGLDPRRPVTLSLKNVTLHEAINCLCKIEQSERVEGPIGFHVEENVIMMHIGERGSPASPEIYTGIYDVAELLQETILGMEQERIFVGSHPVAPDRAYESAINAIQSIIEDNIYGHNRGRVIILGGRMIVEATPEQHAKVLVMIRKLTAAYKPKP